MDAPPWENQYRKDEKTINYGKRAFYPRGPPAIFERKINFLEDMSIPENQPRKSFSGY